MSDLKSPITEPGPIQAARERAPYGKIDDAVRGCLNAIAPSLSAYLATIPLKVFGLDSGFYHLAVAQALEWDLPADAWLEELSVAAAFGSVHYATQDIVIDAGDTTPEVVLFSDVAQSLYLRTAQGLCPPEVLLPYYDRYFDQYATAVIRERRHQRRIAAYDTSEIYSLGDKAAPLNLAFPILINQSRRPWSLLQGIEQSLRMLCVGLQLHDDIADTVEDLGNGYVSYPSAVTLLDCLKLSPGELPADLDAEEVEGQLYTTGVAEAVYGIARKAFERSAVLARDADADAIAGFADYWCARTDHRLRHIEEVTWSLRGTRG
jgi:hypothetical protein